jgi:IS1 family transposase
MDEVFLRLKALLEPFGLTHFYTDHWGAYTRHLDPDVYSPGKRNTQKIERQHLTLRARIKRLVRKTICFSKTIQMQQHLQSSRQNSQPSKPIARSFLSFESKPFRLKLSRCC